MVLWEPGTGGGTLTQGWGREQGQGRQAWPVACVGVKRTQLNLPLGEVEDGGGPTVLVQMGQVWIHGCGKKGIKRDQRQADISNLGNVCKTL